jgi:putative MFS transporter
MPSTPLSPYQRRLLFFLSVATFFEGYDMFALAMILPSIRAEMGLTEAHGGALVGVIGVGSLFAYFLVRKADDWGRRRVLSLTIAGYTIFSLLTAASPNIIAFAAFQLCARVFLIGEWAIAQVYAAEEYPADRRGMVIGIIQGCASFGGILCAGVVPLLLKTPLGWRSVFLVGGVPLIIVAFARRSIRETARFTQSRAEGGESQGGAAPPKLGVADAFLRLYRSPYRGRMFKLALLWALTYVGVQNAIVFWKEFAIAERGFTNAEVGASLSIAAVASLPLLFFSGKLLDRIGRLAGAGVIYVIAAAGVFLSYTLHSRVSLTVALVAGIFGTSAVLPVLNTYTTELFPTHLRSDAFAWCNNLFGRIGYLTSPFAIGLAAGHVGWGKAVASTSVFTLIALVLIWVLLPETMGKELEETSLIKES